MHLRGESVSGESGARDVCSGTGKVRAQLQLHHHRLIKTINHPNDARARDKESMPAPPRTREAYATLLYGDTPIACAAAVLGLTLRRQDPSRDRVAIVRQVSNSTRDILTHGGLWRLHESRRPPIGKRRSFTQVLMRKNELWRLPYERVLYLDADTFVLDDPVGRPGWRAMRLQRLWAEHALRAGEERLAATGVRPEPVRDNVTLASTCFNGGFLLLRPHAPVAAALDALDAHTALRRPEPATGRRCPGLDQPLLNRYFPAGAWRRVRGWRSLTHWLASPAYPRSCALSDPEALRGWADAVHFFHTLTPWENPHCAACARAGLGCRAIVPRRLECPVQLAANYLWWRHLVSGGHGGGRKGDRGGLSPRVRAACLALTEQQGAVGPTDGQPRLPAAPARGLRAWGAGGATRGLGLLLRGGMCTGCSAQPTPACVLPPRAA